MRKVFPYAVSAGIFAIAIVLTNARFWADTPDYVDSVIAYQNGISYEFWEFGHVFWRPLGWLVWSVFVASPSVANWRYEISSVFQGITILSGLVTVFILTRILVRLAVANSAVTFVVTAFIFSYAFLNFSQTGTSYVTALMFYSLGLDLGSNEDANSWNLPLSGLCLALSVSFWMPFLFAIPAVLFADSFIFGIDRQRFKFAVSRGVAFGFITAGIFGIVAFARGINSFAGLMLWISDASHGNDTNGLMRAAFGVARSFVYVGEIGMNAKRLLLHDPYSSATLRSLISIELVLLAAFYVCVALIVVLLLENQCGRRILAFLLASALPLFLFAIFFDGGAVERYLPMFPTAFIALLAALRSERKVVARFVLIACGFVFIIGNSHALSLRNLAKSAEKPELRLQLLDGRASSEDTIYLVNWNDDLVNYNRSFPFNKSVRNGNYRITALVTPGLEDSGQWRETFATRCFITWDRGKNVWLSQRAFAQQPGQDWNWVEGDDLKISWIEFPEFFGQMELGDRLGDANGFVLVPPSRSNQILLAPYREAFKGEILY